MIKKLKEFVGQSEFARNVLMLTSGTAIAQALPILISPILTRIYSPEEFATFGLFSALIGILGVISTGKYEYAVMLPEKEDEVLTVVVLSSIITLFFGAVLLVVTLFFHDTIILYLGNPDFSGWLYLVPISVVLAGFYQIINFWNNRKKSYPLIVRSKIVRSIASNIINLVFGFFKVGLKSLTAFGLIIGLVIGQAIEILMLVEIKSIKNWRTRINLTKAQLISVAKRYSNFPRYDVPSELMTTASVQLPVLLLNRFFEQYIVGLYFQAHKVLSLPMSMIGSSIAQVLFRQLSEVRHHQSVFSDLVHKAYNRLMLIGILPFAIIGVFGREIFHFVFGGEWAEAGVFASLISPWLLFNFIGSPLTIIFSVLEKQKQMFRWMVIMFVARVVSLLIGFLYFKDVYYSIMLFSASGTLFYFSMNFYIVGHLSKVKLSNFIKSTFGLPLLILASVLLIKYIIVLLV